MFIPSAGFLDDIVHFRLCYTELMRQKGLACRQAGIVGILVLILVLVVAVAGGAYYLRRLENSKPQSQNPVITAQDIDSIKRAIAKKDKDFTSSRGEKPPEGEYVVKIDEQSYQYGGEYAIGRYGQVGVAGGGVWIAAKVNGEWKIVYQGNAGPNCDEIAPYNLPKGLVDKCVDETGNLITR